MSENLPFVEKYRPTKTSSIQGNNKSLRQLRKWLKEWEDGDTAVLIHGSPGIGKTTTAECLANDFDLPINEINASSASRTDDIRRIARQVSSKPISGEKQLIVIDECDSFHRSVSLSPLTDVLKNPPNPIIIIAEEDWKVPNSIKRRCKSYEFKLQKRSIKAKLREIAEKEGIDISEQNLGKLATRGNLRAAIQDLQMFVGGEVDWDNRRLEADNFDMVDGFLKAKKYVNVSMNPEELVIWLDENLANDFRGLELGLSHEALARADQFNTRAKRTEDYRYWKYSSAIAKMTKNLRLTEAYDGWIDKGYPDYFRQSTPTPDDDSKEAKLYRRLKGYDSGEFGISGDYTRFRKMVLPILKELPEEERFRIVLNNFSKDEASDVLRALDLKKSDYEEWLEETTEEPIKTTKGIGDW